jgi:MFS family permease
VFSAVAVLAAALALAVSLLPAPVTVVSGQRRPRLLEQLRRPAIALGMWLTALPAVAAGTMNVLGPLRLSQLGAGAVGIGATFLVAAAAEAAISPAVGAVSDRRGRLFPLRIGLAAATVFLLCFTLPESVVGLAVVIVLETIALGSFWAPAMAMLSDAADSHGMSQGYALALINLAWAAGQIFGAGGGGALAKATNDGVPFAVAAGLCALTLGGVLARPVRAALAR